MKFVSSIITVKPGDEDKTRKSLQKVLAPIRKEKGIISFSIYERNDQVGTFVTHEVFQSQEDFDTHMEGSNVKTFLAEYPDLSVEVHFLTEL